MIQFCQILLANSIAEKIMLSQGRTRMRQARCLECKIYGGAYIKVIQGPKSLISIVAQKATRIMV